MPRISCHLVYNSYRFLREAINSILVQNFADFELVLVAESIAQFDYDHPKIRHLSGAGLFPCRNLAIEQSDSEFIAPMDADDISYPSRFTKAIDRIGNNAWIGFGVQEIDEFGNPIRRMAASRDGCSYHSTVLMRRIADYKYPTEYPVAGDVGLFFQLRRSGHQTCNFGDVVGARRIHPGQISQTRRAAQMRAFVAYSGTPFAVTTSGQIIKPAKEEKQCLRTI